MNAVFLDQIAEKTRALSTYSRPEDNLELKVAAFFDKINKPVLANLKLTTTGDVRLTEVYPPRLPDLFHGDQLVVLARYQGSGHAAVVLDGQVGKFDKRYVFETNFLPQADGKPFVEELWARRKVGYLLDQIRVNGERKELVDEVVQLATNYGITTPYTSYLIMPDAPIQVASAGRLTRRYAPAAKYAFRKLEEAKKLKSVLDMARSNYQQGYWKRNQVNELGVNLALCTNNLKCQKQLTANAICRVANRNCMEIGGVWIDEAFTARTRTVSVKAQSAAYFRILERQPQMKDVFRLGNHVLWIAPNGTALVVDTTAGKDNLSDREIDLLFAVK